LGGTVRDLRIDPADSAHAFAVTEREVWELPPSSATWENRTGNLPTTLTLSTIFFDVVSGLFAGTSRGVYRSVDLGNTWIKLSAGLPNTAVHDLQGAVYRGNPSLRVLVAATLGRGAWGLLFPTCGVVQVPDAQTDTAPALAGPVFTGLDYAIYYTAWKNANGEIYVSVSKTSSENQDTFKWETAAQIRGKSGWAALTDEAPALGLAEDGTVYAAWKGKGSQQIWYSSSSDGVTWHQQSTVPGAKTDRGPSLHMAAGLPVPMTVAWRDGERNTIKYAAFPIAGEGWGGIASIETQTDSAPALSSTGAGDDILVFVWLKGEQLMFTTVDSNTGPGGATPQKIVGAASTTGASVGGGGMAWKGEDRPSNVWITAIDSAWPPDPRQPITAQRLSCLFTDVAPAWVGGALAFKAIGGTEPAPILTCFPWA
jgi:hypothetical protein